jgi:hypothetical protein
VSNQNKRLHVVLLSVVTIIILVITITTSPLSLIASSSPRYNITATSGRLGFHSEQQSQPQSPLSIVENMRGGGFGQVNLTKTATTGSNASSSLIANNTSYVFSRDRSELTTPENNTHTGEFGDGVNIALIKPTFTAAAYNDAFYVFYKTYANVQAGSNITTDLNLLTSKTISSKTTGTINSVFAMLQLVKNLKWITQGSNITILTDADVDNGSMIFNNNQNKNNGNNNNNAYDIIILGHQEYVTQKEYNNLKKFVANGGTMIILDGNVFYAEVKYDKINQTVTLVKGHSWAFNGKSAWKSIGERWANETSRWVGSNYLCDLCVKRFANNPFGYVPHEEQYVTNPNDIILLNYNASLPSRYYLLLSKPVIATYELNYQNGKVIALGIYSDDIISNARFNRYLDSLLLQYDIRTRD